MIMCWRKIGSCSHPGKETGTVDCRTGRVVDEKGNPIPGATVLIQGTTQGVATDADGRYTINTRPEDALRFPSLVTKQR